MYHTVFIKPSWVIFIRLISSTSDNETVEMTNEEEMYLSLSPAITHLPTRMSEPLHVPSPPRISCGLWHSCMFWELVRGTISISLNATGVCPRAAIFTPSHQPRWLFIRAPPQQPERAGPAEPHINAQTSAMITTLPWIFHPTYLIWHDRVVIANPLKCYSLRNLFICTRTLCSNSSTFFAPLHSCYRHSDFILSLANSIAAVFVVSWRSFWV